MDIPDLKKLPKDVVRLARKMEAEDFELMDCGAKPKHFVRRMQKSPEATPLWYFIKASELLAQ